MDAAGLSQADVARLTGLSSQLVSQLVNRKQNYSPNRPPEIDTLQRLERIPGLSQQRIAQAVAESMGTVPPAPEETPLRATVRGILDQLPEEKLASAMKLLLTLFE